MRISLVKLELKEQNQLLERIASALERLAPPLPPAPPERKANLNDLRRIDPRDAALLRELEREFARQWNVVPGSEAYQRALKEFEEEIRSAEGDDAVAQLPWNRIGRQR